MMRKMLLTIIGIVIGSLLPVSAQQTADALLQQVSAKFTSARSVEANYTIHSSDGSTSGTILLSGNKFRMTSPQIMTWFDGKTQWTYAVAQQEVNITEPTAQELQQVNPLLIINAFRKNYTARIEKAPAGSKRVRLTAKAKSDIHTAIITVNATTLYPSEITLVMANGHTLTIKITGFKTGAAPAASAFRFDKKTYPKAEIIDLR
ncbi:MAG: outer-membrane lipoprotein carrier protein LolA [Muribaculaceae bacterium]|nr:outer-membrane lipoprotein carrier protein LolA [Muribaculaceae bacterium]